MKINKNKSNKKQFLGAILTILAIVCMLVYLFWLWPTEEISSDEANMKNAPTVTEDKKTDSTHKNTTTDQDRVKTPTKTPGKTPSQYEGENINDETAYNNEQFRIPEEE